MAIKVLALASASTTLTDHRILNGSMLVSSGQVSARGGVLPGATSGDLSTVSAMVARVAPVKVVIPNGVSAALGPYLLVSDANVDITFDNGEAAVPRVDRIIARAYDNTNDGSGSTLGNIYYLKGTSGGSATALPTNSILLYEMTVPAGASSGGGGINFANAVDKRVYTAAQGGLFPVANLTDMNAISNPYEGMPIYRTDLDTTYIYDGTNFKPRGQISVASSATLSTIDNPWDGLLATVRDTDAIYSYNGTSWVYRAGDITAYAASAVDSAVTNGTTASTSFVTSLTTSGVRGVAFTASQSGKVFIVGSTGGFNSTANAYTLVDFEVRTGSTVGSGSVIRAGDENTCSQFQSTAINAAGQHETAGIMTGLSPGSSYNACLVYRVSAGTGTFNRRKINVIPTQ